MEFSNFLLMQHEIALILVFIILFFADIFGSKNNRWFYPLACLLFASLTIFGFLPKSEGEAFGGMFVSSELTLFMKNLLNMASFLVFLQTYKWLHSKEVIGRRAEFFTVALVTLLGMYLMISAGNFMMLYVGMETASLPLAILVAYNKHRYHSAEAGVKFVMISALSSAVMLFGVSFLYGATGTLYFSDMATNITTSPLVLVGLVFFFGGLGFKLSLVPFHLWTADVYEGAPTNVTAYLSVVSKGAASFALIFVLFKVFGNVLEVWQNIIWMLSVATITLGNLFALRQKDIKRFFAFSSISQAGYIVLGVIANSSMGVTATVYYVLVYVFSNLAAFAVISAVENANGGNTSITAFNNLYKSNPKIAVLMMLAVFSLAGIPVFAGFFSKFFVFLAAVKSGFYVLVFIALLNTVISLFYYLLIVKAMFISEPNDTSVSYFKTDWYSRISMLICLIGVLGLGIVSCIYTYIHGLAI